MVPSFHAKGRFPDYRLVSVSMIGGMRAEDPGVVGLAGVGTVEVWRGFSCYT